LRAVVRAEQGPRGGVVRLMFTVYVGIVVAGLAYFIVLGLTHA
jgi:hypothetical protein